jgi:hypothetical protein
VAVQGVSALRRRLSRIRGAVDRVVRVKMDDLAIELLGRSVAVAPELTRDLIKSAVITKDDRAGQTRRIVSYDTHYAVVQHEDFSLGIGPITARKAGTIDGAAGRKYLERPFNNMKRGIVLALGAIPEDTARRT